MTAVEPTNPLWLTLATGLGSGVGGIILGRFSMSKKDRRDVAQKNYENSLKVEDAYEGAYLSYTSAMAAYRAASVPTPEAFIAVCIAGDNYFRQVSMMCNTILSGMADPSFHQNTWMAKIRTAWDVTLPLHYDTLQNQAAKHGFPYTGRRRRQDHESLYTFVEKHSGTRLWEQAKRPEGNVI